MSASECRALAAMVLLNLLTGCGVNGDFGRPRDSLIYDDLHAWIGPAALRGSGTPSSHQLTDDERLLRDLAYPLIEPPYDRNQFYSILGEAGFLYERRPHPDRKAYAARLFDTPYRSQTARYNKLIEDIRSDVVRLDPFFRIAHQVVDIDRKRAKSLAYVSKSSAAERSKTVRRIAENKAIVGWVGDSLRQREAAYQVALERLAIAAPSPNAVEAERSLTLLRQAIAGYGA
jgi:hypothetical protein